jgi:hypothetical protein
LLCTSCKIEIHCNAVVAQEGSKILEDQLRLMDEKYLELRTKLDWQREHSRKEIAKHKKVAQMLRSKFALMGGTILLDEVPVSPLEQQPATIPSPLRDNHRVFSR